MPVVGWQCPRNQIGKIVVMALAHVYITRVVKSSSGDPKKDKLNIVPSIFMKSLSYANYFQNRCYAQVCSVLCFQWGEMRRVPGYHIT